MSAKPLPTECSHCGGAELYTTKVLANPGGTDALLPGLGRSLSIATFDAVLCANCGHYQLFADCKTKERVAHQENWKRIR